MSFAEWMLKWSPRWLKGGDGEKVIGSLGLLLDDFAARARAGLLARFPGYADDEALAALGRDRKIVRGINEPSAAYAARLSLALDALKTRGNAYTLLEQIRAYLQAPCVVRIVDRRGNWWTIEADGSYTSNVDTGLWNWDGGSLANWARFWLIIYPVGGTTPWAPSGNWGDATLWGDGKWGHSDRTIGTTATVDQVAAVRQIVRDWSPRHAVCEWIIIAFDPASFSPSGSTDPAGTWGTWSNHTGGPVRLSSARYWKGPTP